MLGCFGNYCFHSRCVASCSSNQKEPIKKTKDFMAQEQPPQRRKTGVLEAQDNKRRKHD